jgi:leucyl aminopeptidase
MDFELKSLSPEQAAAMAADALLVLVPDALSATPLAGALGTLTSEAASKGDLEAGLGKSLSCYRVPGIKASRVVLVRAGNGSAAAVRKAVAAGLASLKQPNIKKLGLVLSLLDNNDGAVRAAVQACADASYTYTTTKPSAKARALQQVVVAVADASAVQAAFDAGKAMVTGVEFAKEWANRPANHADMPNNTAPRPHAQA